MSRITLIGKTGFMAKALQDAGIGKDWLWLSHVEALEKKDWLDTTDCIINFAYAPELRREEYNENLDVDTKIAKVIKDKSIHYIMLSSRMVYGHPDGAEELHEDLVSEPLNVYGANKEIIEGKLFGILGKDRVTALRLSNIFGFEPNRKSFFGMALTKLAGEGRITYDMNPFVKRDFMSVWRFGQALETIAKSPKGGIYNLGSGYGAETGLIAEWLIEGYGKGELLITDIRRYDIFWLNMDKTYEAFDIPKLTLEDLHADCLKCGQDMKGFKA